MVRLLLAIFLAIQATSALACEPSDYQPTPHQFEQDALNSFRESDFVYNGIILGLHDYDEGGRFLVIRSVKGPARIFDVVQMPGGSSCYGGEAAFAFGVWAGKESVRSFDNFVPDDVVAIWRQDGLLGSGNTTAQYSVAIGLTLLLLTAFGSIAWLARAMWKPVRHREEDAP